MSQELDYKIIGESAQVLEVNLEPGRTLIGDGGSLLYLDDEINFETLDTDGADLEETEPDEEQDVNEFLDEALAGVNEEDDEVVPEFTGEDIEEDDKEQDASLIEKLWFATKKVIKNVGKPGEKKEEKEEEELPLADDFLTDSALAALEEDGPGAVEEQTSWFITHFHNQSEYIRKIAFTTSNSGILLAINLDDLSSNSLVIQTGVFLCARRGVRLEKYLDTEQSITFVKEKFYNLNMIKGEGTVFLQAEGHVIEKELDDDVIRLNLFSLFAYEPTLTLELDSIVKVSSMRFEDDTQFVRLSGTGKFWVQAANLQHLVYKITPFVFDDNEGEPSSEDDQRLLDEIVENMPDQDLDADGED